MMEHRYTLHIKVPRKKLICNNHLVIFILFITFPMNFLFFRKLKCLKANNFYDILRNNEIQYHNVEQFLLIKHDLSFYTSTHGINEFRFLQ